jgi:DNA-binding MarR family transcriptional regulator
MKRILFFVSLLLLSSAAFAQGSLAISQYDITFVLGEDSVRETIRLQLESPAERVRFVSKGVYDITASNSNGSVGFNIVQEGSSSVIEVFPKNDTYVEIAFSSREQVIGSDGTYQFFIELALGLSVKALHADVVLPQGFVIESFYPQENSEIRSDGRSIILSWDFENPQSLPLFVRYRSTQATPYAFVGLLAVIIVFALAGIFYYRTRAKGEFLKGFFEDEGKVVSFMMRNKIAYQNKVEQEFHFSRPKMTRIVCKLEQKGWVKKERRGRTNKLTWIKGTPEEKKIARKFAEQQKKQKQKEQIEKLMGQTEQI